VQNLSDFTFINNTCLGANGKNLKIIFKNKIYKKIFFLQLLVVLFFLIKEVRLIK
jgi:hypothetical protein